MADKWLLQDGSGGWLVQDASGYWILQQQSLPSEESDSWWAGVAQCFTSVAVASALAASALGAQVSQSHYVDHNDQMSFGPAPNAAGGGAYVVSMPVPSGRSVILPQYATDEIATAVVVLDEDAWIPEAAWPDEPIAPDIYDDETLPVAAAAVALDEHGFTPSVIHRVQGPFSILTGGAAQEPPAAGLGIEDYGWQPELPPEGEDEQTVVLWLVSDALPLMLAEVGYLPPQPWAIVPPLPVQLADDEQATAIVGMAFDAEQIEPVVVWPVLPPVIPVQVGDELAIAAAPVVVDEDAAPEFVVWPEPQPVIEQPTGEDLRPIVFVLDEDTWTAPIVWPDHQLVYVVPDWPHLFIAPTSLPVHIVDSSRPRYLVVDSSGTRYRVTDSSGPLYWVPE